ncbi:MAG: roadblock/LC7 domain-containing protein [Candidatus Geothermarchaeales archaeon]
MSLDELLVGLRKDCGSIASAVVSRDGLVVAADLPPDVSKETFSIMCAAIMGAGMTATTELGKSSPTRISLESDDIRIVIYTAGRRSMLVIVLSPSVHIDAVDKSAKIIAEQVAKG